MDQRPGQLNQSQLSEEAWIDDRDNDVDSDTERIKADIEDTRAEMGQTLNEIQERLSPEHLMGQVKETVREATIGKVEKVMETVNDKISNVTEPAMEAMGRAGEKLKETGSSLTSTVRRNPIPFALMGLGLGMFIVNRVRNADGPTTRSRRYQSDREMGYGMATPRLAVRNRASGLMQGTTDTVSNLTHGAKEQAVRAGRTFERLLHENPLAVSAAAVAVGAAVGLALPSTRMEQEYMGELSENVVDKTKQVAREAMDKVKSAAQPEQPKPPQPAQPKPAQPSQPGQPALRPGGTPTA
ncbi:MAG TPA: DUF3618 domain-containing protein [Pyrinomonadaceae bacterium]|nr:DUF3618 domain-containing protein [Pyrinomonadaceae bacterium]